jgi:hypothetical protein
MSREPMIRGITRFGWAVPARLHHLRDLIDNTSFVVGMAVASGH